MMKMVSVLDITRDDECQPRVFVDDDVVQEYVTAMTEGAEFPPLMVYQDDTTCWLADGFHRMAAVRSLGLADVRCDVRPGGKRDAILFAAGANADHGLRRTSGDKRRAIETLLADPEWSEWTEAKIAEHCRCGQSWVSQVRSAFITVINADAPNVCVAATEDEAPAPVKTAKKGRPRKSAKNPVEAAPAQTLPIHVSAEAAADLFGDDDDEDDPAVDQPSAVEWTAADETRFTALYSALKVVSGDPKAAAYAAVALHPQKARAYLATADAFAIWQSRFIHELRAIL